MVAGCVHLCGAFGGKMRQANRYNKKGMFENAHIISQLVKGQLSEMRADPKAQKPLPPIEQCRRMAEPRSLGLRRDVLEALRAEGWSGGPWFFKSAQMCHLWPIWAAAFPEAKWLIVRRADQGIIASCLKTGFMSAYRDAAGWQGWIEVHKERFSEMVAHLNTRQIWAHDLVVGKYETLKEVIGWLGLEMRAREVAEFVEPMLWTAAKEDDIRPVLLNGIQSRVRD
jgi:hypothetical protein